MAGLLSFLVTVVYLPGALSPAIAPRWDIIIAGTPLVLFLSPFSIRLSPSLSLLGGFLAYAIISVLWTSDTYAGIDEVIHWCALSAAVILGARLDSLRPIFVGIVLGLGINSVAALFQYLGYSFIPYFNGHPAGLFANRNLMAELSAPVFIWALLKREWLLIAIAAIAFVLVPDRTAIVAGITSLILLGSRKIVIMGLIGIGLCTVVLVFIAPTDVIIRWHIWQDTLNGLNLFGHGASAFITDFPQHDTAHNDILELLYNYGLGAFSFIGLVIYVVTGNRTPERAAFVVLGIESFASWPFFAPTTAFLGAVLLGYLCNAGNNLCIARNDCGHSVSAVKQQTAID